ncbi:putative pre-mRNA splicing factor ATP-dependent RNA helicase putativedead/h helicase [Leptomonas pyrrhocoris]|uniref:RNA helicase n=1 Tax=Leptomonas pyrrhocoris TaxID=157538 RepID=A0A0M9G390_LEPPY|nr:putative pre-mRNA splicing factor ATP-dependent RNA helicase putativedead/h helicase [Leptomonas pyrrhocoris]KPA81246.1 putative pre-mRNA splicing factor ATP-dependent RNA helicase putativedead/h helicase [Leptomonas pyrrhocoris]|eukprot:XP_015659685.1 putative pre-mRNA splicing factor ATP-dependent RNA helicase putativedead/h helicase [Leptomonas pyrrhocoris]
MDVGGTNSPVDATGEDDAAAERQNLSILMKLQELYCKSVLYEQLECVMGHPATQEESDGYLDDVEGLVDLYCGEKAAVAKQMDAADGSAEATAQRESATKERVLASLSAAINGGAEEVEAEMNAGEPAEAAISVTSIEQLYDTLHDCLSTDTVITGLAVGSLLLAEDAKRGAEEAAHLAQQQRQRQDGVDLSSMSTSTAERRNAMKVSPEEMFRLAQHVRSGLADEADLLKLKSEDTGDEGGADVELNETEPRFLRNLGFSSTLHRRINYRALLPSQMLQNANSPQHRQAILDRLAQKQQGDSSKLTSMERTAQMQEKINMERRVIARKAQRQQQQQRFNEDENEAAAATGGGGARRNAAAADGEEFTMHPTLLHSELDAPPEEGGFRPQDLPSKLPPWMKHSFGRKPRFGLPETTQSLQEQRASLPIYAKRDALMKFVDSHRVTVLVGETGSGKTTQIPQYLVEHGYADHGIVACTQPRRVAAETLAMRVAEEYGCRLGEEVGYTVRFRDVTSSLTKIKYMTDGMLLREALLDDSFQRYSVIILDEAHERSINTDLLFAIVRQALRKHEGLKVMITSATLDTNKFCAYFGAEEPFRIEGRTFPVETYYLTDPANDYVRAALQTVMMIHLQEPPGDVLVFLTGQEEIELGGEQLFRWMEMLRQQVTTPLPDLMVLPLTATMPQEVQSKVFEATPPGCRKVVLATNVAETSITITNLYYVVDSGYCKQNIFDAKHGIDQLKVVPVSQAQAKQRSGRAGRIGPGKCYRMYTEQQFTEEMVPETIPDIMRTSLFHVTLQLKAMGLDLLNLELMDCPPKEVIVSALEKLRYLEALDDEGLLTPLGSRMAQLSIDPSQSKTLLTAVDLGCSEPVLTIVSMLAVQKRGVFYRPRDQQEAADAARRQFMQPEGDQLTLMAVYDAWVEAGMSEEWSKRNFLKHRMLVEARDTRDQLKDMLARRNQHISHENDTNLDQVRKSITAGYFFHAARRVDSHTRSYVTLSDRREVYVHPSSVLIDDPPKYVLYDDLRMTKREYMTELLAIEPKWLVELAPAFYAKPKEGRLTKEQAAERFTPILKSWETGSSWRISRLKKQRR